MGKLLKEMTVIAVREGYETQLLPGVDGEQLYGARVVLVDGVSGVPMGETFPFTDNSVMVSFSQLPSHGVEFMKMYVLSGEVNNDNEMSDTELLSSIEWKTLSPLLPRKNSLTSMG